MSRALSIVTQETPQPRKKSEKICLIETQPEDDWFVPAKTKRGRRVWYLRFKMTGWNPRLFGPFRSKRQCCLVLDDAIGFIQEHEPEIVDAAKKRLVKESCANAWLPLVDHPIIGQGRSARANRRH